LRIRSSPMGGFTYATSEPCGPTTSRPADRLLHSLESNSLPHSVRTSPRLLRKECRAG
jgi:hypothetical protein